MRSLQIEMVSSIYEEHLDEASFLYGQRLLLFDDTGITWLDIDDFEQRMEAHIDALALGGDLALEICIPRLASEEPGDLFAVLCVFCRQDRKDLVFQAIEGIDPEDEKRLLAISDAIRYELPDLWGDEFVRRVGEKCPHASLILARAAGYRRLPAGAGPELLKTLPGETPPVTREILAALGRLRFREACPTLLDRYLANEGEPNHTQAVKTLLLLGERQALQKCLQSASSQDGLEALLGISAGRSVVSVFLGKAFQEKPGMDCLLGLGLLGDISAIESLFVCLNKPESAESAALAINLITGADIYEDAFIPDKIDEDELFPEELEKFRQGQPPARPDGTPYGVNITRLSPKPEDWRQWWANNMSRFKGGTRYRNGKPFTPACLLENIESEKTPYLIRRLAYEELVIRYGMDLPFAANMCVTKQKCAIKDISQWVIANATRFQPGMWYFAGQVIS